MSVGERRRDKEGQRNSKEKINDRKWKMRGREKERKKERLSWQAGPTQIR